MVCWTILSNSFSQRLIMCWWFNCFFSFWSINNYCFSVSYFMYTADAPLYSSCSSSTHISLAAISYSELHQINVMLIFHCRPGWRKVFELCSQNLSTFIVSYRLEEFVVFSRESNLCASTWIIFRVSSAIILWISNVLLVATMAKVSNIPQFVHSSCLQESIWNLLTGYNYS